MESVLYRPHNISPVIIYTPDDCNETLGLWIHLVNDYDLAIGHNCLSQYVTFGFISFSLLSFD